MGMSGNQMEVAVTTSKWAKLTKVSCDFEIRYKGKLLTTKKANPPKWHLTKKRPNRHHPLNDFPSWTDSLSSGSSLQWVSELS